MNACHVKPSQNIKTINPTWTTNSLFNKSTGAFFKKKSDAPKSTLTQLLKNIVGAIKYKRTTKNKQSAGNRSKKKLKNKNSATKKIEPGNPKKINKLTRLTKNSFGHKKLIPLISVINRVLKRLPIASTNKNEFVDSKA